MHNNSRRTSRNNTSERDVKDAVSGAGNAERSLEHNNKKKSRFKDKLRAFLGQSEKNESQRNDHNVGSAESDPHSPPKKKVDLLMNSTGCFVNGKSVDPKKPRREAAVFIDQKSAKSK